MLSRDLIKKQLNNTLEKTDFEGIGSRYQGKVRDNYTKGNRRMLITTDRISAFDVVLGTIPFKGQVLNQISEYWFDKTKDVAENHVIDVPDPNVTIAKLCKPYPVEIVVRCYLTGSAWRDYEKGNSVSGIRLKSGLKKNEKLPELIITPSTKAEQGTHDLPISKEEILKRNIISKNIYEWMEELSLKVFEKGSKIAAKNGLLLVDTKYEFGEFEGSPILMDELHTPDSSRFWIKKSYKSRFNKGLDPEMLDKEYVRQWLIKERNFMGRGKAPEITDEVKIEAALRYIRTYEQITGKRFKADVKMPILKRIENNLKKGGYLK